MTVPALEPGRLAQVALDLPAGTHRAGQTVYRLVVDEAHTTGDVNPNNNAAAVAVYLFLDSDGDGIPDDWELANGLNPFDLTDAARDNDGDGLANLAEYRAGTNPNDRTSYLRMLSIGGGAGGIQVSWGASSNRLYSVQRSSDLRAGSGFTNVLEHVVATPPENTFLDTTATNGVPYFYRIKVE